MNLKRTANLLIPFLALLIGMFAALVISLTIVVVNLQPPPQDVQLLFLFMGGSGGASVLLVYVLYQTGLLISFSSIRWVLLGSIVLLVVIISFNVWLTAQLMFISYHDLTLTIALLIFASIVAVISIIFIAHTWIERIQALGQTAERVARGEFKHRFQVRGNDELARFALIFNQMVDSLEALDRERRQLEQTRRDLIAWVSHDLRTPLAAVRAMNESMLDGIVTDAETMLHYNTTIHRELAHLSLMIDDLFALVQLDAGNFRMVCETTSLRDLISDTLVSMSAKAADLGVKLEGNVAAGLDLVEIAPDKIQRVLYNLLDNALEHTPSGHYIKVEAKQHNSWIDVSVCNSGSVIPSEDIPHIFESFYRGERSRTQRKTGGRSTGLGLAIVRGFVEAHGGRVQVTSSAAEGTRFSFTLPQNRTGNLSERISSAQR